ncbi:uncharacterized protein DUF3445 [Loktanella sp. PT4BL]|jgi:hypothetical protein|uniref:heme-dependent oxidative N-demethylase family protein n=1 Tax=Loktanella sp. PT4BL TaxID=2135611 RepID=UPI000D762AAC|nr:DUF3445 domain-containing protein [Loktanella sp. PT4BL]PXW72382.1 uncharacterized protein DUF3445 [Loktanella sp. PT4BL]
MKTILQQTLPDAHEGDPRLPGTMPCAANDWLRVDASYAAQMAYRAQLLATRPEAVLYENDRTSETGQEVLSEALDILPDLGFRVRDDQVICPDGRHVSLDRHAPLQTLGHLVQEDICILEKQGDEHVMTSAVLCFPANWRLAEKINRPLTGIHVPVPEYDDNIAARVQRLFDGVQVGRPLWRFNKLRYVDPDLHQPYKRETNDVMPFTRSERQCILRLPRTQAVVFTIHTYVARNAR